VQLVITVNVTCHHKASPNSGSKSITPRDVVANPAKHSSEEDQLRYLSQWAVKEHLDFVKKEKQASHNSHLVNSHSIHGGGASFDTCVRMVGGV